MGQTEAATSPLLHRMPRHIWQCHEPKSFQTVPIFDSAIICNGTATRDQPSLRVDHDSTNFVHCGVQGSL